MTSIIQQLVFATKSFVQAKSLWRAELAEDVLSPFFACLVANLADDRAQAWYDDFIQKSQLDYQQSQASQVVAWTSYWQNPLHVKLAERITQATLVDESVLKQLFPVATHLAYAWISEQAMAQNLPIKMCAAGYLDDVASFLPVWAEEIVATQSLSQISVTRLVNRSLGDDGVLFDGLSDDDLDVFLAPQHVKSMPIVPDLTDTINANAGNLPNVDAMLDVVNRRLDDLDTAQHQPSPPPKPSPTQSFGEPINFYQAPSYTPPTPQHTPTPTPPSVEVSPFDGLNIDNIGQDGGIELDGDLLFDERIKQQEKVQPTSDTVPSPTPIDDEPLLGDGAFDFGQFEQFEKTGTPPKEAVSAPMDFGEIDLSVDFGELDLTADDKFAQDEPLPKTHIHADDVVSSPQAASAYLNLGAMSQPNMAVNHAGVSATPAMPHVDDDLALQSAVQQNVPPAQAAEQMATPPTPFYSPNDIASNPSHTPNVGLNSSNYHHSNDSHRLKPRRLQEQDLPTHKAAKAKISTPRSNNTRPIVAVVLLLVLAAVAGAGAWFYYTQYQAQEEPTPVAQTPSPVAPPPAVSSLSPSYLSLTVGQAGELYACRATLGNHDLVNDVQHVLNGHFTKTLCVLDVNASMGQSLPALSVLDGIINVLKTSPYASFELLGDKLWLHTPNSDELARLTQEIGALANGLQVIARQSPDYANEVQQSLQRAMSAIDNLPSDADSHALAWVMSMAIFDWQDGAVPEAYEQLLQKAAERLKNQPNTRLIIAAHRDETHDQAAARTETQLQADMIKNKLVAFGVGEHQLVAQGVGFDVPAMDNQSAFGRFKNRRVEFLVYDEMVMQMLSPTVSSVVFDEGEGVAEPMAEPMPEATLPVETSPQTVLDVENGQIVEHTLPPQEASPMPTPKSSMPIDDELLRPIGVDPAGTGVQDTQIR